MACEATYGGFNSPCAPHLNFWGDIHVSDFCFILIGMKPLYTKQEFESSKSRGLLPFECELCGKPFYGVKNEIQKYFSRTERGLRAIRNFKHCSIACQKNGQIYKCKQCGNDVYRTPGSFKQYNSKHVFCSHSCNATYQNMHKTKGYRRSKLEIWIEKQLTELYPTLEIHYNKTNALDVELDIYIPSLKLAFELNGIFHYEPIYSQKKLDRTKMFDQMKFQLCIGKQIGLCIIDTSHQTKFTEKSSIVFLDIIRKIVDDSICHTPPERITSAGLPGVPVVGNL